MLGSRGERPVRRGRLHDRGPGRDGHRRGREGRAGLDRQEREPHARQEGRRHQEHLLALVTPSP